MEALRHAYVPDDLLTAALPLGVAAVTLLLGRLPSRLRSVGAGRALAWGWAALAFFGVERLTAEEPPGFRMLALIVVLLAAMKVVVLVEEVGRRGTRLGFGRWLAWAGAWPGMRPELFAGALRPDRPGGARLAGRGLAWIVVGVLLLAGARAAFVFTESAALATVPLLPGVSLILHFGVFNVCAGAWRAVGAPTYRLFPAPLASSTLSEFWGRRWNLPFTEMAQRAIYRPLQAPLGRSGAAFAAFVFSGLVHEAAISVPVQAGYGLPMAYFAIHGALTVLERRVPALKARLQASPALGRAWTLLWLALPMPILFHPPFLRGVVWPLIGIGG